MKHQLPSVYAGRAVFLFLFMALSFLVAIRTGMCERALQMEELVPGEFQGWKTEGELEIYDRETIFDYIDGAGEVYRLYGFQKLVVRRLAKLGQPTIFVEIFDMGSSQDAFGVFSHSRQSEDIGIGEGSEQRGGLLCFWKGRFFVCIYSEAETDEAEAALPALAKSIAQKIKGEGAKPKLLDYLPSNGLQRLSIRYFHLHASLNYHYYLADQNILNLGERTEAILARYQPTEAHLLLIRYQSAKEAEAAFARFLSAYVPEAEESGVAKIQEGRWVGARVEGDFVVVVFDAPTAASVEALMEAVKDKLGRPSLGEKRG